MSKQEVLKVFRAEIARVYSNPLCRLALCGSRSNEDMVMCHAKEHEIRACQHDMLGLAAKIDLLKDEKIKWQLRHEIQAAMNF